MATLQPLPPKLAEDPELSAKGKMIRAAEWLFAEKGIEATSLREIAILAGQKNTNAVQYHFESKEGLIRTIWQRHAQRIGQRRVERMKSLGKKPGLRKIIEAVVLPVAECLHDEEGGRQYLVIMSQLVSYGGVSLLDFFGEMPDDEMTTLLGLMQPHVQKLEAPDRRARMLVVAGILFHSLSDYQRLRHENSPVVAELEEETMIRNLVSMIMAAITAQ